MTSINMWFYKGPGNIYSFIVKLFTMSKYSHCLVELPNGDTYHADYATNNVTHLNKTETRDMIYDNIEHYDCISIPISDMNVLLCINKFLNSELNSKYDYYGVILGWLNKHHQDPNKWFCSELCRDVIYYIHTDVTNNVWHTPKSLYQFLKNKGYIIR